MTDEQLQRVDENLAIEWLRELARAEETDPDEPVFNGHARRTLEAIERRDARILELRASLARLVRVTDWAALTPLHDEHIDNILDAVAEARALIEETPES